MAGVGVRVTREGVGLSLPATLAGSTGVVTGDNEDWEDGGGAPGSIPGSGSDQCEPFAHGSMGATETFDAHDGEVQSGTLNANLTVTLTAPSCDVALLELWLTEDGTGGWTVTWPGSVTEQGSHDTTLGTTSRVLVETIDGGTNWIATWVGSSSSASFATPAIVLGSSAAAGVAATVIRSDATIAAFDATVPVTQAFGDVAATGSAAFAAHRDHVHGMPAAPSSGGASEHAHVVSETHLSNGSTTTWTLDQAFEPGSVIAWNVTTLARLTVTEVQPDQATVSAAGTTGDSIVFDYAATLI